MSRNGPPMAAFPTPAAGVEGMLTTARGRARVGWGGSEGRRMNWCSRGFVWNLWGMKEIRQGKDTSMQLDTFASGFTLGSTIYTCTQRMSRLYFTVRL